MMQIGRLREPREIETAHIAAAVVDILARDMDDAFLGLLEEAGNNLQSPQRRRASVANRIVVLCRRLANEIVRYEGLPWWEEENLEEQDNPF